MYCFIGALVMLIWLLIPAAKCTVSGMDETSISSIDDESGEAWESDSGRVLEGTSFFDRFFGNIGTCYDQYPIGGQDAWKKQVAMGFVGGFILFWIIAIIVKPRAKTG